MVRQCAWCLRLMDSAGERLSTAPIAKIYEATHGMCRVCGTLWLEQASQDGDNADFVLSRLLWTLCEAERGQHDEPEPETPERLHVSL